MHNTNNNSNQDKRETLLPPPELLERYEGVSKGLSRDLVEIVKKEQEHRHNLQKKYFLHFRCGQIFGAMFLLYIIYMIFELSRYGDFTLAYFMTAMFGLLIVLILMQYRKDKLSAVIRNSGKMQGNSQQNNRRNGNYRRHNNNNYNNNKR